MAHFITQPVPSVGVRSGCFSRHLPSRDQLLRSEAVWLAVIAVVIVAKILNDALIPITFQNAGQQELFTWTQVLTLGCLGVIGIWCARATGFPDACDARITSLAHGPFCG